MNLAMCFESNFSCPNMFSVCKSCFVQLRDFSVSQFLTHDDYTIVNDVVSSQLNYYNSLFSGLFKSHLHKLQCIQNGACGIVSDTSRDNYNSCYFLNNCTGFLLNITQCIKTVTLVYTVFFTLVNSPNILLHIFLPIVGLIVPGAECLQFPCCSRVSPMNS